MRCYSTLKIRYIREVKYSKVITYWQRTKTDIHIPDAHGGALIASLREILKSNINSCAQQDGMRLIKWDIAEKLNCPQLHSALTNFNRSLDSSTCNQISPAHHSSYNLKMMMAIAIKITIKTKGAKWWRVLMISASLSNFMLIFPPTKL